MPTLTGQHGDDAGDGGDQGHTVPEASGDSVSHPAAMLGGWIRVGPRNGRR